ADMRRQFPGHIDNLRNNRPGHGQRKQDYFCNKPVMGRFINIMDPEVLRRVVRTDFLVGNMEEIAARRAPIFRA
ncbi:hypothetical protein ACC688_37130, partial [Rhizobium ruizarguesonis]